MNEAVEAIRAARKVVITSHIQPDGDAVGSTVALLRALKKTGKKCRAISPSHIPSGFMFFLKNKKEVVKYRPERDDEMMREADLFIIVDCSDLERAGAVGQKMEELGKPILVIDHHSTNESFGRFNYVRFDTAATGGVLMELLGELNIPLSPDLAIPLYVAIVTDSGNFSFPGTSPRTHEKAGQLLRAGVKPYEIHRKLSLDRSPDFIRLTGLAILNMQQAGEGEVAYSIIHHDLYKKFTPRVDELVMLPPYFISIRGVEVGILFLEFEPEHVIVELRSQGLVNVAEVARKLGGGGHSGAAGVRLRGEIPGIVYRVVSEVEKRLGRSRRKGATEELRSRILTRA
jgi:phosphoesterase RecJ-like protein